MLVQGPLSLSLSKSFLARPSALSSAFHVFARAAQVRRLTVDYNPGLPAYPLASRLASVAAVHRHSQGKFTRFPRRLRASSSYLRAASSSSEKEPRRVTLPSIWYRTCHFLHPHVRVERDSGMCVARDFYELWGRSPYTRMFVARTSH